MFAEIGLVFKMEKLFLALLLFGQNRLQPFSFCSNIKSLISPTLGLLIN